MDGPRGSGGTRRSAAANGRGVAGVRQSGAPGVRSGCGLAEGGVRGVRSPPVGLVGSGRLGVVRTKAEAGVRGGASPVCTRLGG